MQYNSCKSMKTWWESLMTVMALKFSIILKPLKLARSHWLLQPLKWRCGFLFTSLLRMGLFFLILFGCTKTDVVEYSNFIDIPIIQNNYVNGSYQIVDQYPQMIVLGAYCKRNSDRYFAGWTECYELLDEYKNVVYEEPTDIKVMYPKNDDNVDFIYADNQTYFEHSEWTINYRGELTDKGFKAFHAILDEIEVVAFIPTYFDVIKESIFLRETFGNANTVD